MILAAVDLEHRWALTWDERIVPINNLFDAQGELTMDPAQAVAFTAGSGFAVYAYAVSEIPRRVIN